MEDSSQDDEVAMEMEQDDEIEDPNMIDESTKEGPRDIGGFTVLGEFKPKEKKKVERILPKWLRNPFIIEKQVDKEFKDINGLDACLLDKLKDAGMEKCFPVQWAVIPVLLGGVVCGVYAGDGGRRPRDICVSAPTGSGKTLTFALPIIQALQGRVVPRVRALVLLPVRDLAIQVHNVFTKLVASSGLRVALVAGKKDFLSEQAGLVRQAVGPNGKATWVSNADIVVATKGRLLDHIDKTEGFDLTHVRFFVIDEADRQMEDIYDDWLSQIEAAMYKPKPGVSGAYHRIVPGQMVVGTKEIVMYPQKLLFSATLSQSPEKLEHLSLFMPMLFTYRGFSQVNKDDKVAKGSEGVVNIGTDNVKGEDQFSAPDNLKEMFMDCKAAEKPLVLLHFIINKNYENVLCFANSVESAHRLYLLAKQMEGVSVAELSSNVHTDKRERIIRKFERGQIKLLICSDVMTRGMDIENVKYVFSYDAPSYIETYIHRVGRTARANKTGTAITLLEGKEAFHFKKMLRDSQRWEKLKRLNVNRRELEPLVPGFQEALKILPQILKEQRIQQKAS